MDSNKTLLVISPGKNEGRKNTVYSLVHSETGEGLASHFCSNWSFAKGDLHDRRPERIEEYKKRFGDYEVKFIDETSIEEDELIEKNRKFFEEHHEE